MRVVVCVLATAALAAALALAAPMARVTQLPDDSAVGYVTVMAHDDWQTRPGEKELIEYWLARPGLITAHGESRYLFYRESDPIYQTRLRQENSKLPAIMVQYADGRVAFKDHGGDTAEDCAVCEVGRRPRPVIFPWNKRVIVTPGPKPDVNTSVVVTPPAVPPKPIPDKIGPPARSDDGLIWGVMATIVIVVGVITFAVQLHRRISKVK